MKDVKYRHNVMEINSLLTFARVKGGFHNDCRDVYFIVLQGANETLRQELSSADKVLEAAVKAHQLIYKRISVLPGISRSDDACYYASCYEEWMQSENQYVNIKASRSNTALAAQLSTALKMAVDSYAKSRTGMSDSIQKNFAVKLLYWTDLIFENDFIGWTDKICIKVIATNVCKETESYFYYMLTLIGADVLFLQVNKDMDLPDALKQVYKRVLLGDYAAWKLEEYTPTVSDYVADTAAQNTPPQEQKFKTDQEQKKVIVHIPKHSREERQVHIDNAVEKTAKNPHTERTEKNFEQLALLAASVVMIAIHDNSGEIIGSGSGIMIGADGYILTNHHVVSDGRFFSVRIEEDDKVYPTDEIIKYNTVLDLAIIRIQRKLKPIPIYDGKDRLVRGQKVVAIGSPLGLFNSVSDGIISGFRKMDGVNMLQFTAPTSHGSSGGAVLNMYGEVIGISTAGFDNGQNINLAVGYDDMNLFVRGFT